MRKPRSVCLFEYLIVCVGFCLLTGPLISYAEVPDTIGFQGRINQKNGPPFSGAVDLTVNIYADREGGTSLFTEVHASVEVTNGKFFIELGSVDPVANPLSALDFDTGYWLGLTVAGDSEMTPRTRFNSVAYARRAERANTAGHADAANAANSATVAESVGAASIRYVRDVWEGAFAGPATYPQPVDIMPLSCAQGEIAIAGWGMVYTYNSVFEFWGQNYSIYVESSPPESTDSSLSQEWLFKIHSAPRGFPLQIHRTAICMKISG